jgi:hypothetical protein
MNTIPWEQWRESVSILAQDDYEYPSDCDWDAFRPYYEDGYSPREAIEEDIASAL